MNTLSRVVDWVGKHHIDHLVVPCRAYRRAPR